MKELKVFQLFQKYLIMLHIHPQHNEIQKIKYNHGIQS